MRDTPTSNQHLEAYLLWLFGYVMFCGSHGDAVSRFLIPHARRIADATVEGMPISTGALHFWSRRTRACVSCAPRRAHSRSSLDARFCCTCGAMRGFPSVGHRSTDRRTGCWRMSTTQQIGRPWGRCGATARFVL
jgi:hypothetical protein